jgi:hypothetical protein
MTDNRCPYPADYCTHRIDYQREVAQENYWQGVINGAVVGAIIAVMAWAVAGRWL